MHVNNLGMRNVNQVDSYRGNLRSRRNAGSSTVNADTFAQQMKKALEGRSTTAESEEATESSSQGSCCKQCEQNSRLITQLMTQNLYMQSGLGGMGFAGYSSLGMANLAAYRSMMGLLGGSII